MDKSVPCLAAPGGRGCSLTYPKNKMKQRGEHTGSVWGAVGCTEHPASKGRGSTSSPILTAAHGPETSTSCLSYAKKGYLPLKRKKLDLAVILAGVRDIFPKVKCSKFFCMINREIGHCREQFRQPKISF